MVCPDARPISRRGPGAGAAGGLGAAVLALGGSIRSGIGLIRDVTGLDEVLDGADLVITGEGSVDDQSLRGKVVAGSRRPRATAGCRASCWPAGRRPAGGRPPPPASPTSTRWWITSTETSIGRWAPPPTAFELSANVSLGSGLPEPGPAQ